MLGGALRTLGLDIGETPGGGGSPGGGIPGGAPGGRIRRGGRPTIVYDVKVRKSKNYQVNFIQLFK